MAQLLLKEKRELVVIANKRRWKIMPGKEIRPRQGEVWKGRFKDANGRDAGEAVCFIYEEGRKLYRAWFGVPWKSDPVEEEMIDGQNGWKRVYAPRVPIDEVFFK